MWRTPSTDSNLHDLRALVEAGQAPAVLMTDQPRAPQSEEPGWPTPPGNLYFAYLHPGAPEAAMAHTLQAITALYARRFPTLPLSASDPSEPHGGHRVQGLLVSGVVVQALGEGTGVGLDLHLGATRADYQRYAAGLEHSSPGIMGLPTPAPRDALWELLPLLVG